MPFLLDSSSMEMISFLDVSTPCLSRSFCRPVNIRSPPSFFSCRTKGYSGHFPAKGKARCPYALYSTVASRDNPEQSQNMSQKTLRPVKGKPSPPRPSSRLGPHSYPLPFSVKPQKHISCVMAIWTIYTIIPYHLRSSPYRSLAINQD
jgi:hypothetical protein